MELGKAMTWFAHRSTASSSDSSNRGRALQLDSLLPLQTFGELASALALALALALQAAPAVGVMKSRLVTAVDAVHGTFGPNAPSGRWTRMLSLGTCSFPYIFLDLPISLTSLSYTSHLTSQAYIVHDVCQDRLHARLARSSCLRSSSSSGRWLGTSAWLYWRIPHHRQHCCVWADQGHELRP